MLKLSRVNRWEWYNVSRYIKYVCRQGLRWCINKLGGTLPLDENVETRVTKQYKTKDGIDVTDYLIVFNLYNDTVCDMLEERRSKLLKYVFKYNDYSTARLFEYYIKNKYKDKTYIFRHYDSVIVETDNRQVYDEIVSIGKDVYGTDTK